jgi:hypothetical protein
MKRQISEIEREIIERNGKQQLPTTHNVCLPECQEEKCTASSRSHSPDIDLHALDPLCKY